MQWSGRRSEAEAVKDLHLEGTHLASASSSSDLESGLVCEQKVVFSSDVVWNVPRFRGQVILKEERVERGVIVRGRNKFENVMSNQLVTSSRTDPEVGMNIRYLLLYIRRASQQQTGLNSS